MNPPNPARPGVWRRGLVSACDAVRGARPTSVARLSGRWAGPCMALALAFAWPAAGSAEPAAPASASASAPAGAAHRVAPEAGPASLPAAGHGDGASPPGVAASSGAAPPTPEDVHSSSSAEGAPAAAARAPRDRRSSSDLEALRQRLAERLGAQPASQPGSPYELKIESRAPAPPPRRGPVAAGTGQSGSPGKPWSYTGANGPQAWARLSPDHALCGRGQRQSPIDIRDELQVELEPIHFDYRPGAFRVIDTGHTIQVEPDAGSAIEVMGRRYLLRQFHFHHPAEEQIHGRSFDMNVHLVHADAEGRIAIVAVLFKQGEDLPVLQSVWNNLPLEAGAPLAAPQPLDPREFLPTDPGYFTYMGSLTTPPCSEGVLWLVMRQPVQIAPAQLALFARMYPMNARPLQPLGDRRIKGPQ